jgi:hypothetical protein
MEIQTAEQPQQAVVKKRVESSASKQLKKQAMIGKEQKGLY